MSDEVTRITQKARDNTRSLGVALAPGSIPGASRPTFELPPDEIEIGMGLHGEPGVKRGKLIPANDLVDQMLPYIIEDLPFESNDKVCVLINGLGSTTRMELMIVLRRVTQRLKQMGIQIHDSQAGNYATTQEMAGFSITLMKLDEELKQYFDYPAWSPAFTNLRA